MWLPLTPHSEPPAGHGGVAVDRPGKSDQVFAGQFEVQRYERPRLSLRFELDQPVVFRGEPHMGRTVEEALTFAIEGGQLPLFGDE